MELISINNQNTLPEQVSVNKANIAILAEEVEKLGYTLKGVYDDTTAYKYNDVVYYNNCMYRVADEEATALVGVLPTDTTYWQQITGDIRGQQGPAGPAGQDGTDGTDGTDGVNGKNTLWWAYRLSVADNAAFLALLGESSHNFSRSYFNRDPDVDDDFFVIVHVVDSNMDMLLEYKVVSTSGISTIAAAYTQYAYAQITGNKGDNGAAGEIALVYDRSIAFTYGGDSEQLISENLPIANFNRTPALNEDFIAILNDDGTEYLANCEVQTISGSYVTSIVASDIAKVSGADGRDGVDGTDGTDGTNGTNGLDALVYSEPLSGGIGATIQLPILKFNRTPQVNDTFIVIAPLTNYDYLAQYHVTSLDTTYAYCSQDFVVNLRGAQGPAGAGKQLYAHNLYITDNSIYFTCKIINDSSTAFVKNTFLSYLSTNGFNSNIKILSGCGAAYSTTISANRELIGVAYFSNQLNFTYITNDATPVKNWAANDTLLTVDDIVITL